MRYWSGVLTGIVASIIGVLAFGTFWLLPRLSEELPALRADGVPKSTEIVLGPLWAIGAPAVLGLLLLVVSFVLRKKETALVAGLTVVTVAGVATVLFTVMGCYMPLAELDLSLSAG